MDSQRRKSTVTITSTTTFVIDAGALFCSFHPCRPLVRQFLCGVHWSGGKHEFRAPSEEELRDWVAVITRRQDMLVVRCFLFCCRRLCADNKLAFVG